MQLVILYFLYTHRENRERRIGIDRVKDAVEKCLQQVEESCQKLTKEHLVTLSKYLDMKQTMIKNAL